VTISAGQSFDKLFDKQKQEAPEGCWVSVWKLTLSQSSMSTLGYSLDQPEKPSDSLAELFSEMNQIEPSSVVFNFECCGGCSDTVGFGDRGVDTATIKAISLMLQKGYFVMMSDFSVKAIISCWDSSLLGLNPFVQIGTFSSNCTLRFVPNVLKECESSQLVTLGLLSDDGRANVGAMSSTIVFAQRKSVNLGKEPYSLKILTVATDLEGIPAINRTFEKADFVFSEINEHKGVVGQAILSYQTGGKLILSSCHWISLTHISTSEENVFQTFAAQNGTDYAFQRKQEYEVLPECERGMKLQEYANNIVQCTAPCGYTRGRSRFGY